MMHGIGIYKWQALFYFMLFYFILQVTAHNAIPFIFVLYVLCEVSCSFGSTCSLENFTSERELVSHKYFLLWVEKGANLQRAARWSVSGVTWKKKKRIKKSHSHTSFVTEQWLPVVLFSHIKISVKLPRLNYNQHSRHSRWELVGRSEFTTLFEHIPMAQQSLTSFSPHFLYNECLRHFPISGKLVLIGEILCSKLIQVKVEVALQNDLNENFSFKKTSNILKYFNMNHKPFQFYIKR